MVKQAPAVALVESLQEAFGYFNDQLFDGRLESTVFVFAKKPGSLGHFAPQRWHSAEAQAHEISLNPIAFRSRDTLEVLSTLVHEQVHLEQQQFGKPGRGGYHNVGWGKLMERVGLIPSATGQPDGKKVGDRMTHYVEAGGRFETAARRLIARGYAIPWGSVPEPPSKSSQRTKYECACSAVWGKPDLNLACLECEQSMASV